MTYTYTYTSYIYIYICLQKPINKEKWVLIVFVIFAPGTEWCILSKNQNPVQVSKSECDVSCIHATCFSSARSQKGILTFSTSVCMHACMYMYVYVCICMYVYVCVCMYVFMYVCMYVRTYVCMYVSVYVCMYVSVYVCMYVSVYVCMSVCVCMCVCACMHVCMSACMHACLHVCMYVCVYVCMHACMHACMSACMYVCMDACMPGCLSVCLSICLSVCMYVHYIGKAEIWAVRPLLNSSMADSSVWAFSESDLAAKRSVASEVSTLFGLCNLGIVWSKAIGEPKKNEINIGWLLGDSICIHIISNYITLHIYSRPNIKPSFAAELLELLKIRFQAPRSLTLSWTLNPNSESLSLNFTGCIRMCLKQSKRVWNLLSCELAEVVLPAWILYCISFSLRAFSSFMSF